MSDPNPKQVWPINPDHEAEKVRKQQLDAGEAQLRGTGELILRKLGQDTYLTTEDWLALTCYLLRFR